MKWILIISLITLLFSCNSFYRLHKGELDYYMYDDKGKYEFMYSKNKNYVEFTYTYLMGTDVKYRFEKLPKTNLIIVMKSISLNYKIDSSPSYLVALDSKTFRRIQNSDSLKHPRLEKFNYTDKKVFSIFIDFVKKEGLKDTYSNFNMNSFSGWLNLTDKYKDPCKCEIPFGASDSELNNP